MEEAPTSPEAHSQSPPLQQQRHVTVQQGYAQIITQEPGAIANPYHDLQCRPYARFCAYFDIILSVFESCFCVFLLVVSIQLTVKFGSNTSKIQHGVTAIWGIHGVCCLFELYFSIRLIRGTHPMTPQPEAVLSAKFWRLFNITLILTELCVVILNGLSEFQILAGSAIIFFLVARIAEIFFVHKFLEELQSFRVSQQMGGEWVGSLPVVTTTNIPVIATVIT